MNPLFTNLTQETLAYLEDQLSNNDVAGDDELIDQGPLHQADGLSFDPHTKSVR